MIAASSFASTLEVLAASISCAAVFALVTAVCAAVCAIALLATFAAGLEANTTSAAFFVAAVTTVVSSSTAVVAPSKLSAIASNTLLIVEFTSVFASAPANVTVAECTSTCSCVCFARTA